MKQFRNQLSKLVSGIRPFMIAAACALVLFSSAAPALAFGNSNSKPAEGLEQLDDVQNRSEQAIKRDVEDDTQDVIKNSQEGLNGVQGRANKKDMISPSNASGNTIEGNIEEALDDITP